MTRCPLTSRHSPRPPPPVSPHLSDTDPRVTRDEAEVSHSPGHWAPPAVVSVITPDSCYKDDRVRLRSPELVLMGDEDPLVSLQPLSQLPPLASL